MARSKKHLFLWSSMAAFLAVNLAAGAQSEPSTVRPAAAKALTPGSCLSVADGDTLTLDWNPGFQNMSEITGLQEFTLRFATEAEIRNGGRGPIGSITLEATPRSDGGYPFRSLENGYYQTTFHVHVDRSQTGEYRLTGSQITPAVVPGSQGELPKATHSPEDSPFCFTVTGPSGL